MADLTREEVLQMGYLHPVYRISEGWCGILKLMFTHAIVSEINQTGYGDRWCYKSEADAKDALMRWSELAEEPKGWHRHPGTGRRIDSQGNLTINF